MNYGYQFALHVLDWYMWQEVKAIVGDAIIHGIGFSINGHHLPLQDVYDFETEQREGWSYDHTL